MKIVNFQKFTSYGNNFIIVDETQGLQLQEDEKPRFACQATDVNFGIGADGVLFIQPYRSDILKEINRAHNYWEKLPVHSRLDLVFRIFEPNGMESFSCGNGLMCLANFLNRRYNMTSTPILTQIPTAQPKVVTIGTDTQSGTNWAKMGLPKRVPPDIVNLPDTRPLDGDIDIIKDMTIRFRERDLHPFSDDTSLNFTAYLVYTGEPHLVIFPATGFSIQELKNILFVSSYQDVHSGEHHERRSMFGSWLIDHVGMYLNKRYVNIFPNGINVNFVHIPVESNELEYRCFERGINEETLACGTGALAVSFVARRLNLVKTGQIVVRPHRSRWYDPEASILVDENENCWSLHGRPVKLLEGQFRMSEILSRQLAAVNCENPAHNQRYQIPEAKAL